MGAKAGREGGAEEAREGETPASASGLQTAGGRGPTSMGDVFGRYRFRRELGRGGMARVYEAEHIGLRKAVAVKVMEKHLAANATLRQRFLKEGERASRIRHPNVVDITDVGEFKGLPFLVMEVLRGESLGDLVEREGQLSVEVALNILLPVFAAVATGHAQGVVHRDLKPDNIFLHRSGSNRVIPKVLDFGVSRALTGDEQSERLTLPNSVLGTPYYMAPEQARGEECDGRADQYALAAVFYEILTGTRMRRATTLVELLREAARGDRRPLSVHLPDLEPRLEEAVMRALEPDREARFPDTLSFASALLPFAGERVQQYWEAELSDSVDDDDISYDCLPPEYLSSRSRLTDHVPLASTAAPVGSGAIPTLAAEPDTGFDDEGEPVTPTSLDVLQRLSGPHPALAEGTTTIGSVDDLPAAERSTYLGRAEPAQGFPWYVLLAFGAGTAALAVYLMRRPPSEPAAAPAPAPVEEVSTVRLRVEVVPREAKIYLDGALLSDSGNFESKLQREDRSFTIRIEADGYRTETREVRADADVLLTVALEEADNSR